MPKAKLKDGTVEDFQSQFTGSDWRETIREITAQTLTGSADPFPDVEFQGGSGRTFKLADIEEIVGE